MRTGIERSCVRDSTGGSFPLQDHSVTTAIARAGMMGITEKQIAEVTSLTHEVVTRELSRLVEERSIARVGRGLWVLGDLAIFDSTARGFRGPSWYNRVFEKQNSLRIGKREGEIQFNPNEKLPVHRWWPYVQGFSAEFVRETCRRFRAGRGSIVLDPFCGSGTVPVVARELGASGIGIDLMPIASFVASAKCEWDARPSRLRRLSQQVLTKRSAPTIGLPFLRETPRQFRPDVMDSLLRIKENVWDVPEGPEKTLLKLAFASIVIDSSNLKRAPCLGYTEKPGLTVSTPFELFEQAVGVMNHDLSTLSLSRESWGPKPKIVLGDSGRVSLGENSIDIAITSPPYVNGLDYPTNYKLDMAWMDLINDYHELSQLRAAMVACDNIPRGTVSCHRPGVVTLTDEWITSVRSSIDFNIGLKATYRRKDMGKVVTKYFDDLVPVIQNVYHALRPGGRFVVVNGDSLIAGTYIPGDMIFARLGKALGFDIEEFTVARTRRSGQRRGFLLRETVTVLRKKGNGPREQAPLPVDQVTYEPR